MMEFASSVSGIKCMQTRVNVVISIKINKLKNRVGSEEEVHVVINVYSQILLESHASFVLTIILLLFS